VSWKKGRVIETDGGGRKHCCSFTEIPRVLSKLECSVYLVLDIFVTEA